MVTIKKISKPELPELIKVSYEGDIKLIQEFHPAKSDEYGTILSTVEMIEDVSKEKKCSYYKVMADKKPIGYFVVWEGFLYSFAINIKYRTKEVLMNWWQQVKSVLGKVFQTMLYEENHRGIAFLLKQGMKIKSKHENIVTLINN